MIQITGNDGDWWYWWYRIITGANVGKSEMWCKDYSEIRKYGDKRILGASSIFTIIHGEYKWNKDMNKHGSFYSFQVLRKLVNWYRKRAWFYSSTPGDWYKNAHVIIRGLVLKRSRSRYITIGIDIKTLHSRHATMGIGIETHGLDYYYRNWNRNELEYILLGGFIIGSIFIISHGLYRR